MSDMNQDAPQVDESNLRKYYKKLLDDSVVEQLEQKLGQPNIFEALGIERVEIRHTNFLAWLLSPKETHGLGDTCLIRFLRELAETLSDVNPAFTVLDVIDWDLSECDVRREWKNIDLLLVFKNSKHVICIENKIDSKEHSKQLAKYAAIVNDHFPHDEWSHSFFYLTPNGDLPSENMRGIYTSISYSIVATLLNGILNSCGVNVKPAVNNYLNDYLNLIKRHIMKTDSLNEQALKIYKQHKELFDFVFENKPDDLQELTESLSNYIENLTHGWQICSTNKGHVRFLPEKLFKFLPKEGRWRNKESFLFEFYFGDMKKISFQTVVSPIDNPNLHSCLNEILSDCLKEIKGYRTPRGEQWLVHYKKEVCSSLIELPRNEHGDISIKDLITQKDFETIFSVVNTITNAMKAKENELISFCKE